MKSSLSQCPLGQTVPLYDGNNATPNTPELPSEPSKPNTPSTPSEPTSGKLARLSGITRYDTMSWIVDTAFPDSTSTVIVASGENYPDALAASGFAGVLDAPILMTDPLYLSNQTKDQISRLKPGKIIIVGGQNAVSRNVEQSLVQYATVQRIGGVTRGDTALKLYDSDVQGEENWGRTAIVVTGGNGSSGFADALSVSSYAYASKSPIFLSDINFGLSSEQLEALSSGEFDRILVVGGQQAVPDSVMKQIRDSSGSAVSRISGATRYETSITFAQRVSEQGDLHMNNVVFATGANFPDALAEYLQLSRPLIIPFQGHRYCQRRPVADRFKATDPLWSGFEHGLSVPLPHVELAGVDPYRVVHDAVEDGVGDGVAAETAVPFLGGQLGRERGAGVVVAQFHELKQEAPELLVGLVHEPFVDREQRVRGVFAHELGRTSRFEGRGRDLFREVGHPYVAGPVASPARGFHQRA